MGNLRPAGRIRPTCACRNHDYSLYGYKFPLKISMKINESSAKINIVFSTYYPRPSIMCKTSHIYLKLTHQNYLYHSKTLASLPRLAPNISAFRLANYVFWRSTFKGIFRAAVHAAAHVLFFYPVHQIQFFRLYSCHLPVFQCYLLLLLQQMPNALHQ